jgi:DNA recombination protein RmuC
MDAISLATGVALGAVSGGALCWLLARQQAARLDAELRAERRSAVEKLAIVEQAHARLREAFASLSADALRQNNQSFLELARSSLGEFQQRATGDLEKRQQAITELVKPLKDSLEQVDSKLQQVEKERVGAYSALDRRLQSVIETEQRLQSETAALVRALRSPNVRGDWGELALQRILEATGMVEHCHFEIKESVATEDGRLTPDVLVVLAGGKKLIIDSKVPCAAYLDALETTNDDTRAARMKDHARQVRDHILALSKKQYWAQFEATPDLVVMFLPSEALLHAALQQDSSLLDFGLHRKVMLASPVSLIGLLRSAAFGWQQERIAANAEAISKEGRELFERIRVLADHFLEVGHSLGKSVDAYNRAVGSLESRALVTARRLKELGVTTNGDLPEQMTIDKTPRQFQSPELRDLFEEVRALDGEIVEK